MLPDEILDIITEMNPEAAYPTDMKEAIIGMVEQSGASPRILLDKNKCLEILEKGMTKEEAIEFFYYNTIDAHVGENPGFAIFYDDYNCYDENVFKKNPLLIALNSLALSFSPVEGNILYEHPLIEVKSDFNPEFYDKRYNLFTLASGCKNIMEIGFNAGHSALLMLSAAPEAKMVFFDLNFHKYTAPCFSFLKQNFNISAFYGDSTITVPSYIGDKFDLIHVDGCHELRYASKDYENIKKHSTSNTIIIYDDTTAGNHLDLFLREKEKNNEIAFIENDGLKKTDLHTIFRFKENIL